MTPTITWIRRRFHSGERGLIENGSQNPDRPFLPLCMRQISCMHAFTFILVIFFFYSLLFQKILLGCYGANLFYFDCELQKIAQLSQCSPILEKSFVWDTYSVFRCRLWMGKRKLYLRRVEYSCIACRCCRLWIPMQYILEGESVVTLSCSWGGGNKGGKLRKVREGESGEQSCLFCHNDSAACGKYVLYACWRENGKLVWYTCVNSAKVHHIAHSVISLLRSLEQITSKCV